VPGNIRELKNVIERAVLLADEDVIEVKHLPLEKMGATWVDATPAPVAPPAAVPKSEAPPSAIAFSRRWTSAPGIRPSRAAARASRGAPCLHRLDEYALAQAAEEEARRTSDRWFKFKFKFEFKARSHLELELELGATSEDWFARRVAATT